MAVAAFSLAFAAPALADESSVSGYSPDDSIGQELGASEESPGTGGSEGQGGGSESAPVESRSNSGAGGGDTNTIAGLPFTGLDLGLIVGAAAMLALLGLGLRRLTSTPSRAV